MISKLLFLVATVLFAVLALGGATHANLLAWGLASVAAGLLLQGIVP